MYNLSHFKANNQNEVIAFMKANPFIMLCGVDENQHPVATHIPVLFEQREGKIFLLGHAMRKQQHTVAFENNNNVLAIFHAPHTYVSASWYEDKKVASTWNYEAVHAKGVLKFLDEKALYNLLVNLTNHFEGNPDSVSAVKNLDETYVNNNMKAIVAFEIEVTDIQHVFKLSQNRDKQSHANIIEQLNNGDEGAKYIANQMQKNKQ